MASIKATPNQIDAVATNLIDLSKQLIVANTELLSDLKRLSQTFRDEKFIKIQSVVKNNEDKTSQIAPDIIELSKKLKEYANVMRKSG